MKPTTKPIHSWGNNKRYVVPSISYKTMTYQNTSNDGLRVFKVFRRSFLVNFGQKLKIEVRSNIGQTCERRRKMSKDRWCGRLCEETVGNIGLRQFFAIFRNYSQKVVGKCL